MSFPAVWAGDILVGANFRSPPSDGSFMGIYDRDYYRDDEPRGWQIGVSQSVVINLIVINVLIYLVDALLGLGLSERMALNADLLDRPWNAWQLVTAGFAHSDRPTHVIFNMLMLWFFGRDVEGIYGPKEFLKLYLSLVICASLTWLAATDLQTPRAVWDRQSMLGASGAITGIFAIYVCHFPFRKLYIYFILPVPVWLVGILWLFQDVSGLIHQEGNIAYAAHVGGALFGFLFYKTRFHLLSLIPSQWFSRGVSLSKRGRPKLRAHVPDDDDEPDLSTEADAILEKISRLGQGSLTPAERQALEAYSRRMQRKLR
jgi:membrane associated rhomboid family serine protease